eukprot:TRINITY_DN45401_c0_g1_i1.p1 TRINITY_DN45401_c0_g1~~TRINITY_DN45401_c0_g1_i1.p1  ORF type:complete len:893 (+),score=180.53 TRINITY_DN45401_c0_g1_i1:134-2812(+)
MAAASLQDTFRKFLDDTHGSVSCDTIRNVLRQLDPSLDPRTVDMLLEAAGRNDVGTIDYCQFLDFVTSPSRPTCLDAKVTKAGVLPPLAHTPVIQRELTPQEKGRSGPQHRPPLPLDAVVRATTPGQSQGRASGRSEEVHAKRDSYQGSAFAVASAIRSSRANSETLEPYFDPNTPHRAASKLDVSGHNDHHIEERATYHRRTSTIVAEGAAATTFSHVVSFGTHRFRGAEAAPHLERHGLPLDLLDATPEWTLYHADAVAAAVTEWAVSRGATMVCHWTQPLRSAGASWRASQPTKVVHAMFNPAIDGRLRRILDGQYLIHGETECRKCIDVSSPIWVRGDTLFVPCVFLRYNNSSFSGMDMVLDEKTPLLRAQQAMSRAGVRLLKLLGHECQQVLPEIGLEQEFFLISRASYYRRPDLQQCGRTLIGAQLENGTNLYDTHSSPLNGAAEACMQAIQKECFKLGVHVRTRHRESAPNQYEYAPYHGLASSQVDENLQLMEIIEEVARAHGLVALLHEKPFCGVNGSGKHNNFSLISDTKVNLMNEEHCNKLCPELFPLVMAAMARAVYRHGDLMMASTACPGNDFRLTRGGGCEAPPCCMSTHFGESVTAYLQELMTSTTGPVTPYQRPMESCATGVDCIDCHMIKVSPEPRNRTAPFPYAGRRFELRTPGSSQNVSMVNTVLCAAIAESMNTFADAIEQGKTARQVTVESLKSEGHKAIYNGNCYEASWYAQAKERGLACIDSCVDRVERYRSWKAVSLFQGLNIFSEEELHERTEVIHENYVITVEIEVRCLLDMCRGLILPVARRAGLAIEADRLTECLQRLELGLDGLADAQEFYAQARLARELRLDNMVRARRMCDDLETKLPAADWPLATYKDLLLNDFYSPGGR